VKGFFERPNVLRRSVVGIVAAVLGAGRWGGVAGADCRGGGEQQNSDVRARQLGGVGAAASPPDSMAQLQRHHRCIIMPPWLSRGLGRQNRAPRGTADDALLALATNQARLDLTGQSGLNHILTEQPLTIGGGLARVLSTRPDQTATDSSMNTICF